MLAVALALGSLIASPQLMRSLSYYPRSIRAGATFLHKTDIGNIPWQAQLRHMVWPRVDPIDGVFGPEACTFIGLPALLGVLFAHSFLWWSLLGLSLILASGYHTPLFQWTHWAHLRIPARYCYFVSLSLAFLSLEGFSTLVHQVATRNLPASLPVVLVLLQAFSLLTVLPHLWPMEPYVQRWERPGTAFNQHGLASMLAFLQGGWRVSGLFYPLRTGHIHRIRTLGYTGGSQAAWMRRLRDDPDPNGSGAHDWFMLNEDGERLDRYGVKYAFTYRSLRGKWRPCAVSHWYENPRANPSPPSWEEMAACDGNVR